jgi:hypothetical protein
VQIRETIEYKYSSPHQKFTAATRKEKKEFLYPFLQIKTPNFKNPSKIKGL